MIPDLIFVITGCYLAAGAVFTVVFLAAGIKKVDASAVNSPVGFRVVIIPGIIVFWPLLLRRWLQADHQTKPA